MTRYARFHLLRTLVVPRCFCLVFALVLNSVSAVDAQETLVYSFEPDLEGFTANPADVISASLETSGLGATQGLNSMKVVHAQYNGFAGVITTNPLPASFPTDPNAPGIDYLRFDLTVTGRFSPPDAVSGVDPTFADLGITFFGTLPNNPEPEAQIQYLYDQKEVGSLDAGTYTLDIDLRNNGGDFGIGAGLNVDSGEIKGYDGWIDAGFVPTGFQIYSNKSVGATDPRFEWTFYLDNIRVGRAVPGDYNGNGSVDAADYVLWRKGGPLQNEVDTPGTVDAADYTEWRARFGNPASSSGLELGSGATVPEPAGIVLWLVAANCCAVAMRWRRAV